jgi:hypothetical protein
VTPSKKVKVFNYDKSEHDVDSSCVVKTVRNKIPLSQKTRKINKIYYLDTLEKFKKHRRTVEPIMTHSRISTSTKSLLIAKIKDLADQLRTNKMKISEAISIISGICNYKNDFKIAAELEVNFETRNSFIHHCVVLDRLALINFLFKKSPQINLNIMNNKGETPLHIAAKSGTISMIKLLVHLGASLKPINFAGKTPLDLLKDNDLEFLATSNSG